MQKASHYVNIIKYQVHDSVAQLDRAFDYESKGQGFESLLGHQTKTALCQMLGYSPYESSLAPIIFMVGAILFAQK